MEGPLFITSVVSELFSFSRCLSRCGLKKDLAGSNAWYREVMKNGAILSPEECGLTDDAVKQMRQAVYAVCTGEMTIDEAIAKFGSFEK